METVDIKPLEKGEKVKIKYLNPKIESPLLKDRKEWRDGVVAEKGVPGSAHGVLVDFMRTYWDDDKKEFYDKMCSTRFYYARDFLITQAA